MTVTVTGAGGFIGGHLVRRLLEDHEVRAVDIKPLDKWHQLHGEAENLQLDCSWRGDAVHAVIGSSAVFDLAADMGGMGFIANHKADCMLSVLTGSHLLLAAREHDVERFFFASSACVYPSYRQVLADVTALREPDAYPADPEDGYGWEKLFTERLCRHFRDEFGLETRVARYHNIYGPYGTWAGGREKAPAAICRKVATAVITGRDEIEVWGDGEQSRSFTYIDDCVTGTLRIMAGAFADPLNLGSAELVTINELVSMVEEIAGVTLKRRYNPEAPQGVRGRNSDNALIRDVLDWEPSISLTYGLEVTYRWIYDQVKAMA